MDFLSTDFFNELLQQPNINLSFGKFLAGPKFCLLQTVCQFIILACHFICVSTLVCVCDPHLGEAVWQPDWCRYVLTHEPIVWFMFLTITSFHSIRSTDALYRPEYWDRPVIKFRCFQLHCHSCIRSTDQPCNQTYEHL